MSLNKNNFEIRFITEKDAVGTLDIYAHYVKHTVISFEYETPTVSEYAERVRTTTIEYPWLICLQAGKIIGYAYASKHRYRTAYNWSPESTVYVSEKFHGRGIAKILYATLFEILELQGYFNVYAGVALPNEKSVAFHLSSGFEEIGIFKNVGYKHGHWHSTQWFQRVLQPLMKDPPPPQKITEIKGSPRIKEIIAIANQKLKNIRTTV